MTEHHQIMLSEDMSRPDGGYARLRFCRVSPPSGSNEIPIILEGGPTDAPFLSQKGWQATEYTWQVPITTEAGDLVVVVGPEITHLIEDYTTIVVQIPSISVKGIVSWEGITPAQVWEPVLSSPPPKTHPKAPPDHKLEGSFTVDGDEAVLFEGVARKDGESEDIYQRFDAGQPMFNVPPGAINNLVSGKLSIDLIADTYELTDQVIRPGPRGPNFMLIGLGAVAILVVIGSIFFVLWPDTIHIPPEEDPLSISDAEVSEPDAGTSEPTDAELFETAKTELADGDISKAALILDGLERRAYGPALIFQANCADSAGELCPHHSRPDDRYATRTIQQACEIGFEGASSAASAFIGHIEVLDAAGDSREASDLIRFNHLQKLKDACGL